MNANIISIYKTKKTADLYTEQIVQTWTSADCGLPKMINIGMGWGQPTRTTVQKIAGNGVGMGNNIMGMGRGLAGLGGDGDDFHPHAGLYWVVAEK